MIVYRCSSFEGLRFYLGITVRTRSRVYLLCEGIQTVAHFACPRTQVNHCSCVMFSQPFGRCHPPLARWRMGLVGKILCTTRCVSKSTPKTTLGRLAMQRPFCLPSGASSHTRGKPLHIPSNLDIAETPGVRFPIARFSFRR